MKHSLINISISLCVCLVVLVEFILIVCCKRNSCFYFYSIPVSYHSQRHRLNKVVMPTDLRVAGRMCMLSESIVDSLCGIVSESALVVRQLDALSYVPGVNRY